MTRRPSAFSRLAFYTSQSPNSTDQSSIEKFETAWLVTKTHMHIISSSVTEVRSLAPRKIDGRIYQISGVIPSLPLGCNAKLKKILP